MPYKTILVQAEPAGASAVRLRCAAALADEYGATIIGLGAEALQPIDMSAGGVYVPIDPEIFVLLREQVTAHLLDAEAGFNAVIAARPSEWRTAWAPPTEALSRDARGADLIVIGGGEHPHPFDPARHAEAARVIVASGRPVLQCPQAADHLSDRAVVIAWKDTREARRAVSDALPLLQRARDVYVVAVCSAAEKQDAEAQAADVTAALGRQGVSARAHIAEKEGTTSATLLSHADRFGAGLIVAGAYGHSRLGEWAFGGVTRSLLEQDRHFVLFSH
jgi:nucleotide-binding universal stress UspA family protein